MAKTHRERALESLELLVDMLLDRLDGGEEIVRQLKASIGLVKQIVKDQIECDGKDLVDIRRLNDAELDPIEKYTRIKEALSRWRTPE